MLHPSPWPFLGVSPPHPPVMRILQQVLLLNHVNGGHSCSRTYGIAAIRASLHAHGGRERDVAFKTSRSIMQTWVCSQHANMLFPPTAPQSHTTSLARSCCYSPPPHRHPTPPGLLGPVATAPPRTRDPGGHAMLLLLHPPTHQGPRGHAVLLLLQPHTHQGPRGHACRAIAATAPPRTRDPGAMFRFSSLRMARPDRG